MLELVPALPLRHVLDAEIGGEIDHARPAFEQRARLRHCHSARGGKEDHVAAAQRVGLRLAEGEVHTPAQAREHRRHCGAGLLAGGDSAQLDLRMLGEKPEQLHAGVAGAANNSRFNHAHQSQKQKSRPRRLFDRSAFF
jgi:hypothetical protein